MQYVRSFVYLKVAATAVFGVIVLVSALLPLSIQRYVIPRAWGRSPGWQARSAALVHVEGQEHLPQEPFVSLWKHSSTWDTRPDIRRSTGPGC
jgi:hypothetical protein